MIGLKKAYNIAKSWFLETGDYVGISEIRETETEWLFMGLTEEILYGSFQISVPKNGDEIFGFNILYEPYRTTWECAKQINNNVIRKLEESS